MKFTPEEMRFLMQPRVVENAARGGKEPLNKIVDMRELGCPEPIFERTLERRAKKLGRVFAEFRARRAAPAPLAPAPDLDARIAGGKLF